MTLAASMAVGGNALADAPPVFRTALGVMAKNWGEGALDIVLPGGRKLTITGQKPGPTATLEVRDYRFMRRVMGSGAIGFAEGFMAGEWDTPDLPALLEVFSLNFDRLQRLVQGQPWMRLLHSFLHARRRNTRQGSRQEKQACKAGDEKTRSECRNEKRDTKQTGRQTGHTNPVPGRN